MPKIFARHSLSHLSLDLPRVCSVVLCEFEYAAFLQVLGAPLGDFCIGFFMYAWLFFGLVHWAVVVFPVVSWVSGSLLLIVFLLLAQQAVVFQVMYWYFMFLLATQ